MTSGSSWASRTAEARQHNLLVATPGNEQLLVDDPLYRRVPKDPLENSRYRREWIEHGRTNRQFAGDVWALCKRSVLWYINVFGFLLEPRKSLKLPFITYPYQDRVILDLVSAIRNGEERAIEKSRDMGATWMVLYVLEWLWHFHDLQIFRVLSAKEDLVDAPGDERALFQKLDFILDHQPRWLRPPMVRTSMHLHNERTGSTIDGESTNANATRGGRATAVFGDEMASMPNGEQILAATADVADCRIWASTPKGQANAFFTVVSKPEIKKIRLHWTIHPVKAKGLYFDEQGRPRSPWYDGECKRRSHPMEIAQELDIDYLGSDYVFFESLALDRVNKLFVAPPVQVGEMRYDPLALRVYESAPFEDSEKGRLKLWRQLDARLQPQRNRDYIIACDIATGTGASNSAISIGDTVTREKIGEWADPNTKPEAFANMVVALARWFRGQDEDGAMIIWEANGPGRIFGDALIALNYPRLYWRTKDGRADGKLTEQAGWYSTTETKLSLLGEYRRALAAGEFIVRSQRSIDEARQYVFLSSGGVAHSRSAQGYDPSGARDNHGDMVIADALLWHGMGGRREPEPESDEPEEQANTFASRQRARREQRSKANQRPRL